MANEGCIIHPLTFSPSTLSVVLSYPPSHRLRPLFLCQRALCALSSGPCNTRTSCGETVVWCFSVSAAECCRNSLGTELVPNEFCGARRRFSPEKTLGWIKTKPPLAVWTSRVVLHLFCMVKNGLRCDCRGDKRGDIDW